MRVPKYHLGVGTPSRILLNLAKRYALLEHEKGPRAELDRFGLEETYTCITDLINLTDNIVDSLEFGADPEEHIAKYKKYRGVIAGLGEVVPE